MIKEIFRNRPTYRPRPREIRGHHCFSSGRLTAFVHRDDVLDTIALWARQNQEREILGHLVGRDYRDNEGIWCVVDVARLADSTGGPSTVETTVADGVKLAEALEQDYPTRELSGWFHSHLCDLEDYSATDRANQAEWRKPYSLGLLVVASTDAVKIHAFGGPESERLDPPYHCVVERSREADNERGIAADELVQAPSPGSETGWHSSVGTFAFLTIWPLVVLISVHKLANALAQQPPSVVIERRAEVELTAPDPQDTTKMLADLDSQLRQLVSAMEEHSRDDQSQEGRDTGRKRLLDWIPDLLQDARDSIKGRTT